MAGKVLKLPEIANELIHNLCEHHMALYARVRWYENRPKLVANEDARVRLLRSGRDFAAWLGLTPANKSSGGKEKLGRITTPLGTSLAMPCRAVNG